MTNITQEDRDAAAAVAVLVEMRELIRDGRADHHAEPFACHRIAAEAKEREEVVREIAEWLRKASHEQSWFASEIERKFLGEKA